MTSPAADLERFVTTFSPLLDAYFEARAEAMRTGLPASRPVPGGRLTFDPAVDGDLPVAVAS